MVTVNAFPNEDSPATQAIDKQNHPFTAVLL